MLKARQYYRRVFNKDITPNILCYQDLKVNEEDIIATFSAVDERLSDALLHDLKMMHQATNLGSLIIPHTTSTDLEKTKSSIVTKVNSSDLFHTHNLRGILQAIVQLSALSKKYHCVVDNPPYMGSGNMNKALSEFVRVNYPKSKADLMACFMEAGLAALKPKGFLGMINQHSWMFLSSYEKLREHLIATVHFDTMLHLGSRTFPEIGGEVVQNTAFTFCKQISKNSGNYIRLVDYGKSYLKSEKALEAIQNNDFDWFYKSNQNDFEKIPGSPIGYWLSESIINLFKYNNNLRNKAEACIGMNTGNNSVFVREWSEISSIQKFKKWFPYSKGGEYRKWYGNRNLLLDWENDGELIRSKKYGNPALRNQNKYFRECLSWSYINSGDLDVRYYPEGGLFDSVGPSIFMENRSDLFFVMALLNSKVGRKLTSISPTLAYTPGQILAVPIISNSKMENSKIEVCIKSSIQEYDSRETSWDFSKNELIRIQGQDTSATLSTSLEEAYDSYCHYWQNKFFELHKNEEELNKQFIDIYGLKEELTPDVPLKDITILKEETTIKKGTLVFRESEIMAQFISYAVGCMFGRYSLDKQGLVLANQGETLEDYLDKLQKSNSKFQTLDDLTFVPDDDNVIPILDNEWFEDDIVNRFYAFLKATFGKPNFDKNLAFVEDAVGDIRKYFLKTFYIDHVKRYKKRPIYWLFSSPSGAFNALIYMHRYTPDTLNTMLNGYLKEYQEKLKAQDTQLDHVKNVGTDREKISAEKEQARISKVLIELQEYDRELFKIATERIAIDLDDGVLVNYNKFGNVIKQVSGLNDKKAKDKVKKFDWIDVTEIQ
jgi:hypothetical protein